LTARVEVNRVWLQLFGEGIVATPDNFGHLGSPPTHRELLDYLAVKFVTEERWSVKQLVRSLVLTHVYQLGNSVDAKAEEADPADTLLWRAKPRRLKAEQLRDSILAASGRLDLAPPHSSVAAEFGDGYYGVNIWESDLPQHYYKRSVYLPVPRDMVPESLSLFDLPNPNLVGAKREETTSPSQALFLMNNAFVQDEALHLARELEQNKTLSNQQRIERAYLAVYQRKPSAEEVKRAVKFIYNEADLIASAAPADVVLRSSTPEPETTIAPMSAASSVPENRAITKEQLPAASPAGENSASRNAAALTAVLVADAATNGTPGMGADQGANGGGYRAVRGPRNFKGPGSASDIVVGRLAPGIAQPKVFHQALPEKPATPEEGALALFTQALFGSAEFRYLQ
jgi:hypothetical protein